MLCECPSKQCNMIDCNLVFHLSQFVNFIFPSNFFLLNFASFIFRNVYHCPFCNLCRVGRGLGIDYFHCMKCNCCLGIKSASHKCLEKGLEMNCPICCDDLFTSSAPVRALPCGHYMHSACFQVCFTPIIVFSPLSKQKGKKKINEIFSRVVDSILYFVIICQAYTCSHYTCPICSKSLGDMAVRRFPSIRYIFCTQQKFFI